MVMSPREVLRVTWVAEAVAGLVVIVGLGLIVIEFAGVGVVEYELDVRGV